MSRFAQLHDLSGKVAVVTGGSRGIGRAIVQALAEAGADVVIASRKLPACEAAAGQVGASTGRRAVAVACHVGRWADCEALIAATVDRFGRLDVLVNNAGRSTPRWGSGHTAGSCSTARPSAARRLGP